MTLKLTVRSMNIRDLYRGINDFKKGYHPRTNVVRDEKGDLVADCYSIVARWRIHFSQLFTVHGVSDARQTEIHTAEPLVLTRSASEVERATEKLERHNSPGIDQTSTELIKAGGRNIRHEIHKFIKFIWNKEELPEEWGSKLNYRYGLPPYLVTESYFEPYFQAKARFT